MPIEYGGVHVDGEAAGLGGPDRRYGAIEYAFLGYRFIVVFLESIEMHRKEQVGRRLELIELLLQQQRVGAQRYEFLARHDASDDGTDILVDERFAARNRHHGGAAFVDRRETLID